jgi:NAD(P)-dependent dehydrogenase (short-subunit alcohol dehydrogenase family)/sugar phosphate isomerase/epimerase
MPTAAALKAAAERAGARIGVINSGRLRPKGYALLHRDPAIRRASIEVYKRLIDLAGSLGARVGLGMARGPSDTTVSGSDLAPVMRDVFGEIAAHAAQAGTVVMLEPADPGNVAAVARISEAVAVARSIASPGFGIMLDTYQIALIEDSIEEGFAAAEGMANHIHLYDHNQWPPGVRGPEHQLDWRRVAAAMTKYGFSGSGSMVLAPQGDVMAAARKSTAFIRSKLMAGPAPRRFAGKRVLVTGGASGIGRAIGDAFAREGAFVLFADLSADLAADAATAARATGGQADACTVDVKDAASVEAMMKRMNGRLDVLVCAAGLFVGGTAEATSLEDWRRVIEVNLTGTFICARAAIPLMRANGGGSIVTVSSSTGAHDAVPNAVAYVSSKGGVTMLTKSLAVDHAAEGIRVNCIAPGPTDTPMLRGIMDEAGRRAFGESLPIRRLGEAAEFAGAALFLASDDAAFVTGAVLAVDGGQTALV